MNAWQPFAHWKTVRHDLLRALDQLADEQLEFTPREGLRSLGQVARHIAEAEEGWFRHVVTRELEEWPTYPDEQYPTVESIKGLLSQVHDRTQAYLASLDASDLEQVVKTPWGEEFPLRLVVWHVLEHEIHHRGEIYLMLGLMGMEAPEI